MAAMLVEQATHPQFVSNTFLVADGRGGPAFFVDAGGPLEGLFEAAQQKGLEPSHVLLTHHHYDHVSEVPSLRERWPEIEVLLSPRERQLLEEAAAASGQDHGAAGEGAIGEVEAGDELTFGDLRVRALHTPGHTGGMLSFLVTDERDGSTGVFTGDTLFKGSVGGVKAPGHTTYTDLRDSIMGTLMELDPETIIYPGHAATSTVAREWEDNAFIRVWRGLDQEGSEPCTVLEQPATLVLLGDDYDGGTKAWVRWEDGSDDIVPGSKVQRGAS
jgi:glyoxylase-like metal-dependent hydrolase (beta-lactamase superfamily II)